MANVGRANNTRSTAPVVEIYVRETGTELNRIQQFLDECNQKRANAVPYANEDFKSDAYNNLIYEYDAQTLRDILPAKIGLVNGRAVVTRPEGRYRQRLVNFFDSIATEINANIILINSESTYCRINEAFENEIKRLLGGIPQSDRNTFILLIACNSIDVAQNYNKQREENPFRVRALNSTVPIPNSHKPFLLGFDGMVHTIKEDIYICRDIFAPQDFPSLLCATPLPTNGNTNIENGNWYSGTRENKIKKRILDRQQCCNDMLQEFPRHFIKSFKGDRDCIKVTREAFIARMNNLLTVISAPLSQSLTAEKKIKNIEDASIIRKYTSGARPFTNSASTEKKYDGIHCKSGGDSDPCGINGYTNIVNERTIRRIEQFSAMQNPKIKRKGRLIFTLMNDGRDFFTLWNQLLPQEKTEFVTDANTTSLNEDIRNATPLLLLLKNVLPEQPPTYPRQLGWSGIEVKATLAEEEQQLAELLRTNPDNQTEKTRLEAVIKKDKTNLSLIQYPYKKQKMDDKTKLDILKELLSAGADANVRDTNDNTIESIIFEGFSKFEQWIGSGDAVGVQGQTTGDAGDIRYVPASKDIQEYIISNSNINITHEKAVLMLQEVVQKLILDTMKVQITSKPNIPTRRSQMIELLKSISRATNTRLIDPNITLNDVFPAKGGTAKLTQQTRTREENLAILNLLRGVRTVGSQRKKFSEFIKEAMMLIGRGEGYAALFNNQGRFANREVAVETAPARVNIAPTGNAPVRRSINNLLTAEPPRGLHVGGKRKSKTKKNRRVKRQTRRR